MCLTLFDSKEQTTTIDVLLKHFENLYLNLISWCNLKYFEKTNLNLINSETKIYTTWDLKRTGNHNGRGSGRMLAF